jgi:hypothetical protein
LIKTRKDITKIEIEDAIIKTDSMSAASKYLKVDLRRFRLYAEMFNLYVPKEYGARKKFKLEDILNGLHPQYGSLKLSKRLVKEGYKLYKCEKCNISDWNNSYIQLELDHIDGDSSNNELKNLELLCPNCHSQTPTFKNKRRPHNS